MEVDEALKMIISLGVVVPEWRRDKLIADTEPAANEG